MEPPPDVMRATRMLTGAQRAGRMRTGAKTATKDQERDYLERFREIAADPSILVPRWTGTGPDPLRATRAGLEKVRRRQGSARWLRWYARGKKLHNAYAQTLLVLESGKIPSFASMKFRGRDVKFVLRGRGLRDKLIAVQNHHASDVRLLGYVDLVRRKELAIVSTDEDFFATPVGHVPAEAVAAILRDADVPGQADDGRVVCEHGSGTTLRYEMAQLGVNVDLCRMCVKRLHDGVPHELETHILVPGGEIRAERRVGGSDRTLHPSAARAEFDAMVEASSADASQKAKEYTGVKDEDLLEWADESLRKRLADRADGFLAVDRDLWLGAYDEAAERFGATDVERKALAAAFRRQAPRLITGDASVGRLLEPAWREHGADILREVTQGELEGADLTSLAALRPTDALAALGRQLQTEARFAEFPRLATAAPPLRLAHDLFKAHRTGDSTLFQRRLSEGVRDPATKAVALALARAFGQNAGIEWQYAPHEKDQSLFYDPAAKVLARSTPPSYLEDLAGLAAALGVPAPIVETRT